MAPKAVQTAEEAAPGRSSGSLPASQLPWAQIPSFVAGETDLDDYGKKLTFLASIWPEEHIGHLAPRAALQCDPVSFKKISRISPEELKSKNGVAAVLAALGLQWGRFSAEDRYLKFERALFLTVQKGDETNDSYLARHDACFEEVMAKEKGISLEEIRAYILLRHSALAADDKKRIIVESDGVLKYGPTRDRVRLLGSKFFTDLHGQAKPKNKTYDVNVTETPGEEDTMVTFEPPDEHQEEQAFQLLQDQGDEDAVFVAEFEEEVINAVQESSQLASCFSAYQEARARLRERVRQRGFWPPGQGKGGSQMNKGKGKKSSWKSSWAPPRKTLAERIANSTCRICSKPGHWKRECPQRFERQAETTTMAETPYEPEQDPELMDTLPEDVQDYEPCSSLIKSFCKPSTLIVPDARKGHETPGVSEGVPVFTVWDSGLFGSHLRSALHVAQRPGRIECASSAKTRINFEKASSPILPAWNVHDQTGLGQMTEEASDEAILDTGASRTVIGSRRVEGLVRTLKGVKVKRGPSSCVFKFGNSGTLQSQEALFLQRKGRGWLRVEIVPGSTPFLLSNAVVQGMKGVIDSYRGKLWFHGAKQELDLRKVRRRLICVSVRELLNVDFDDEKGEVFHSISQNTNTQHKSPHHMHDSRIQNEETPNKQTEFQHPTDLDQNDRAAQETAQAIILPKPEIDIDETNDHGNEKDNGPPLHGGRAVGGRRPDFGVRNPTGLGLHLHDSTGDDQPQAVGTGENEHRQTCRSVIRCAVRDGRQLCEFHPAPQKAHRSRHAQLPELLHGPSEEGSGGITNAGEEDKREILHRERVEPHRLGDDGVYRVHGSSSDPRTDDKDHGEESGQLQGDTSQEGSSQSQGRKAHDHRAEPAAHSSPSDSDRSAPEGTGSTRLREPRCPAGAGDPVRPDSEPKVTNSKIPVAEVQKRLTEVVQTIEDGLSTLPTKEPFCQRPQKQVCDPVYDRPVDLLEIFCFPQSQMTTQMNKMGGKGLRFTLEDGDLSTVEGVNKLWTWIYMYEPLHIWTAPDCKGWGGFSRLNMTRSRESESRILFMREFERRYLKLCNDIYWHQVSHGRHFHLEQPQGSDMLKQPEVYDIMSGTLTASFDQCTVGKLRVPGTDKYLRKRSNVQTTSRLMHQMLHGKWCQQQHEHQTIEGSYTYQENRQNISAFAARYTTTFAQHVVRVVSRSRESGEDPLVVEELLAGFEASEGQKRSADSRGIALESLRLKRRRCDFKQVRPPAFDDHQDTSWDDLMKSVSSETPRVGVHIVGRDVSERSGSKVPEMDVRLVISCRGTDRYRIPPNESDTESIPLRKTIYVHRQTGECVDTGPPEEWLKLSKLKRIRACGPSRLAITIFGKPRGKDRDVEMVPVQKESQEVEEGKELASQDTTGWAPRPIAVSGPAYNRLSSEKRQDISRLHQNLGHPSTDLFVKFLRERGSPQDILDGAAEFQCATCAETVGAPMSSKPGTIHRDLDFNDEVGCDGVYWSGKMGKSYYFVHFLDEGTLFHLGTPCSRTTEDQIRAFEDTWLQWAGPCKTLYVDPAGEYVTDKWRDFLQKEGIQLAMTAGGSPWQLGRTERHGAIIKGMLTRMDNEQPIQNEDEFRACLRHAFAAKNSLSRVNGFTPEQALLGKARTLPGSLVSDDLAGSHVLAESGTPEGIKFRESLWRREQARRSFISADNDSSFRRALLRRTRPSRDMYEKGDWVLYWKRTQQSSRREKGRWYGPSQVIAVEGSRVLWLSHGGGLVRASPEQVRPASLREYHLLPKDSSGGVKPEVLAEGKGPRDFISLEGIPDEEYEPSEGPSDMIDVEIPPNSQPESEMAPPSSPNEGSAPEVPNWDGDDMQVDGTDVPVPSDDELFAFGDDQTWSTESCFEIAFKDGPWATLTPEECCSCVQAYEILLTTSPKKERIEVRWGDLSAEDRAKFSAAKNKELKAWLDHGTVKRVTAGTLQPEEIMRCRWILVWKPPRPQVERDGRKRV